MTTTIATSFSDFEDVVIYQTANHAGAEAIVTRDPNRFKKSSLPVYNPGKQIKTLEFMK